LKIFQMDYPLRACYRLYIFKLEIAISYLYNFQYCGTHIAELLRRFVFGDDKIKMDNIT
jgi:hypothetical protein